MASGTAPQEVNGTGNSHPLNPEARIFVPRQNFAVNNRLGDNRQQNGAGAAAATTAAAAVATTTAAAAATVAAAMPVAPITAINYNPYLCPPIVPVVYPSVYGTPGTVFFMPRYQVPYSAVLLPMDNGNGDFAYFYRVKKHQ